MGLVIFKSTVIVVAAFSHFIDHEKQHLFDIGMGEIVFLWFAKSAYLYKTTSEMRHTMA